MELVKSKNLNPALFDKLSRGQESSGIHRLQLFTARTTQNCEKEDRIPIDHYALVYGRDIIDVGENVDAIILAWRPKALDYGSDPIVISYDPESSLFEDILSKSAKMSSKCMAGVEFLLYLPEQKKFATWFAFNATSKVEARKIRLDQDENGNIVTQDVVFSSRDCSNKKGSWVGTLIRKSQLPLEPPDEEEAISVYNEFINEKGTDLEYSEDEDDQER